MKCIVTEVARITRDPTSVVVFEATMATLSCEAYSSNISGIIYEWKRVNGGLVNGVNSLTLTIPSVTQDDEDEYYCTASYGVYVNGTSYVAESERARITVIGKHRTHSIHYHQFIIEWNWYSRTLKFYYLNL